MNLLKYREHSLNSLMSKMDTLSNSINLASLNVSINTRVYQIEQDIRKTELSNMSVNNVKKLIRTISPKYNKLNDYVFSTYTVREKDSENYSIVYLAGHVYGLSKNNMDILLESLNLNSISDELVYNLYTTIRDFYLTDYDENNKSTHFKYLGSYYSSAIIKDLVIFIKEFMPDVESIINLTEDNSNNALIMTNYTIQINFK